MRKTILVVIGIILIASVAIAGEKEELSWKAKALLTDLKLKQTEVQQSMKALTDFAKELDEKGLMYDGQTEKVVEKPKPKPPEKKAEPPKQEKK